MIFRFLRMHMDQTTAAIPSFWKVEAKSRNEAIQKFCAAYGLQLAEVEGEPVWFELPDRGMVQYLVDEGREA